jgi:enoyl-[acyl-carrier protein] reductase III
MSSNEKRALVTGSSRGIGRGIALKLAEKGIQVAIHFFEKEAAARATLASVRELGSDGFIVQADVAQPEQVGRMFENVRKEFGGLDIFVNNARGEIPTFYQKPLELTLEQWDATMNSQAKAFLISVRESVRLMNDKGRIIAITYSPGSRTGSWQPWVAMGSAKAALESLVRYFAVALAERGITVNALSPGFTEDSVLNSLPPQVQEMVREWHGSGWTPMKRLGTPADVGKAVTLLCSEDADWITGQIINVDGGSSLVCPELPLAIQRG